jgi:two-component sensor histidine kinase/DNA-binding response OmpR family regulator
MEDRPVVLVVDDEPQNLVVLTSILQPSYSVRAAKSGAEALRILARNGDVDLILLDIMMPGVDGFEVLQQLKSSPETEAIPVIIVSSLDDRGVEERGLILGAVDYLTKPVHPMVTRARVAAHVEIKRTRDQLKRDNATLEALVSRRTEEALRARAEQEESYRTLFQTMMIGFLSLRIGPDEGSRDLAAGGDPVIVDVNRAVLGYAEISPEETLRRPLTAVPAIARFCDAERVRRVYATSTSEQFDRTVAGREFSVTVFRFGVDRVACLLQDISERQRAYAKVTEMLEEKRSLLQEIHHRVKNNLNVIASLLSIQAASIATAEDALQALPAVRDRILAMALVHDHIYRRQSHSSIDIAAYLQLLLTDVCMRMGRQEDIDTEVFLEEIPVSLVTAVPCALLCNEIITNAVKHMPHRREGNRITLDVRRREGQPGDVEIIISDNGDGIAPELLTRPSIGFTLINALSEQIGATTDRTSGEGTRYTVQFSAS